MEFRVLPKQQAFIEACADEVLFGGAAGGGKSYAQMIDVVVYAFLYPKSRQLVLRRTFKMLEKSLIPLSLELYSKKIGTYKSSERKWYFCNGSVMEFGYLDTDTDVTQYMSAEYDVIRFDELTHFTEYQYTYMLSRLRGAKAYPRSLKSSTNPGSVGHAWVKQRFIDPAPPDTLWECNAPDIEQTMTRIFIPAKVTDNTVLMQNDPKYIPRLQTLPEKERKALLDGNWNIFEGQFFSEWDPRCHVCKPFMIPNHWRRYVTLDYGMDMLAVLFIAVDDHKRAYVYQEIYQPGLIISQAANMLAAAMAGQKIDLVLAPPDLWNRRQETGKSVADLFAERGVYLTKTDNDRATGWMHVREWLALRDNEFGGKEAGIRFFDNCINIIRTLPQLQYSPRRSDDVANEPHELTHAPDALRGFATWWVQSATKQKDKDEFALDYEDEVHNLLRY